MSLEVPFFGKRLAVTLTRHCYLVGTEIQCDDALDPLVPLQDPGSLQQGLHLGAAAVQRRPEAEDGLHPQHPHRQREEVRGSNTQPEGSGGGGKA